MLVKLRAIAEARLPEITRAAAHPAEYVNAVGDVADGHFIDGHVVFFPPHFTADCAVQLTDPIGGTSRVEGEHGHAELLGIVLRIETAKCHQFFVSEVELLFVPTK